VSSYTASKCFDAKPQALPRHRQHANAFARRGKHHARNRSETCLLIKLIDHHFTVGKARHEFQLSAQRRDELAQGADVNVVLMFHL
jgi:hypothetical protein